MFYLGCAVWSHKEWVGHFYPKSTPARDFLHCYSDRLNTVEGNTTFYAVPEIKTVQKWRSQTPDGFKFCPKFPKTVTHQGLLCPQLPAALSFIERMQGLGDRLGILFVQLPPRYSPEQSADLHDFLTALPRDEVAIALEVRHPHWFHPEERDRLNAALQQLGVHRVILDTRSVYSSTSDPQVHSRNRKPQLPVFPDCPTDTTFIRFISHPDPRYHEPFLGEWVNQVTQWLEHDRTVYFFVHCPIELHSPQTAQVFYQRLQVQVPLPCPDLFQSPEPTVTQLNLFNSIYF